MKKYWLQIVGGITVAALVLGFFLPIKSQSNTFFWNATFNASHFFIFFGFTVILFIMLKQISWVSKEMCGALSIAVVLIVELIQPMVGRSFELIDIWYGLLGTSLAWLGVSIWKSRAYRLPYAFGTALLSLPIVLAPFEAWKTMEWRESNFPTLAEFASQDERLLWREVGSQTVTAILEDASLSKSRGLLIHTMPNDWSGVEYDAGDSDWSDYTHLTIKLFNPSDSVFPLLLRVDDDGKCEAIEDRYNGRFLALPGDNVFSIALSDLEAAPETRTLNLERIRRLLIAAMPYKERKIFLLSSIKLTNGLALTD